MASAPGTYEGFAKVYDAFTASSDYETWTGHVLRLAVEHGLRGRRLLDVACGTGKSFRPFVSRGFDVTGCDVSPAMLAEARAKAPDVTLVEADMRDLPTLGEFDLVTCFDDSLNHMLDEGELVAALRSMSAQLAPEGLLLFDLNTQLAFRTTFARQSVFERDSTLFACRGDSQPNAPPGCIASVAVDAFVALPDGHFDRVVTTLRERHFPPQVVTALLVDAGLECAALRGVLDDGTPVQEVDETSQLKLIYAARLAKGGERE